MVKRLSSVDQNSTNLTNVPTPVLAGDAVNKGYVDSGVTSLRGKDVTVTTPATTAAKVGTTAEGNYVPAYGDVINVTFTLGMNVANPTLNIDGSGAKNIRLGNTNVSTTFVGTTTALTLKMWYDGTYWQIYGSLKNDNTTYAEITDAEITAGTATTARAISGRRAKTIIDTAQTGVVKSTTTNKLTTSSTEPASPAVGDIWIDSDEEFNPGTGGFVAQPDEPVETDVLWYDTDDNSGSVVGRNADTVGGVGVSLTPAAGKILVLDSNKMIAQENWSEVSYTAGWGQYDAGTEFGGVQYMKDTMGFVHMRGLIKNTSGATKPAGNLMFTLPVGYRPARGLIFAVQAGSVGSTRLDVQLSGNVFSALAAIPAGEWVSFAPVTFKAEQ